MRDREVNRKRNCDPEVMARPCSPRRAQKTWGEQPACHRMSDQGQDLSQCVSALKARDPCLMLGHKKMLEAEPTNLPQGGISSAFWGDVINGEQS